MNPIITLDLMMDFGKEANGLHKLVKQLENPETASTIGGLRSSVKILAGSMLRTNEVLMRMVTEATNFEAKRESGTVEALHNIFNEKRKPQ